jgi:hypothetical protein
LLVSYLLFFLDLGGSLGAVSTKSLGNRGRVAIVLGLSSIGGLADIGIGVGVGTGVGVGVGVRLRGGTGVGVPPTPAKPKIKVPGVPVI